MAYLLDRKHKPYRLVSQVYNHPNMGFAKSEAEIGERVARFVKAELKRADVTYEQLAARLKDHGLTETRDSIAAKLRRGTFPATFLLAVLAALEMEAMRLEDL